MNRLLVYFMGGKFHFAFGEERVINACSEILMNEDVYCRVLSDFDLDSFRKGLCIFEHDPIELPF